MRMRANVQIHLRPEILDPQGKTIEESLPALGFQGVSGVRVGKSIVFLVEGENESSIRDEVEKMCREFLANPVIETYDFSLSPIEGDSSSLPDPDRARTGGL